MVVIEEGPILAILAAIGAVIFFFALLSFPVRGLRFDMVMTLFAFCSSSYYVLRYCFKPRKGIVWPEGVLLVTGGNVWGFIDKNDVYAVKVWNMSGSLYTNEGKSLSEIGDQFFGSHKRLVSFFRQVAAALNVPIEFKRERDRFAAGE